MNTILKPRVNRSAGICGRRREILNLAVSVLLAEGVNLRAFVFQDVFTGINLLKHLQHSSYSVSVLRPPILL
jgi:small ligand-binding sensory domain FIST